MTDPWARPADEVPPHPPVPPPPPQYDQEASPEAEPKSRLKRLFRDPLSIVLVVVIVLALAVAGIVGTELVARRIADSTVTRITSCVVQDSVDVSFGPRPIVLQYLSDNYNNITVTTGGERIREAEGMKAEIVINDVQVTNNPAAPGTVGALDAKITWSADGIKRTIQNAIPLIGSFVNGVTTNASDGTIELQGMLGSIVTKPEVRNNELTLTVEALTGLGFVLPRESVQPALDAFLKQMTENYPLGIKADSVEVTDSGVVAKFFSRNAAMPPSTGQSSDPCFAGL
ncbi:LmeA family phospholipid-binding protein [Mycolicibacterium frederiksbergense]|uniref:LmeA family phospholipid-binding protein n=1 Tax=Mycolicibacterium frederiksbergense TaxID=117567 RepID=UPI00399BB668